MEDRPLVIGRRIGATLTAAVLLTAACSSTARRERTTGGGRAPASPADAPAAAAPTEASVAPTKKSAAGRSAAVRSSGGSAARTSGAASLPGGPVSTTIKIGFVIPTGDPGRAFGTTLSQEGHRESIEALVAEINEAGGLGGRRIVHGIREVDQTDQSEGTQTRIQNETCTAFTEDDKVFMVISAINTNYVLDCYAKHQTPILDRTPRIDAQDSQRFSPWALPPLYLNLSRMARLMPLAFEREAFLTKRMGLFSLDTPPLQRTAKGVLIPEIERRGGKILAHVAVAPSYNDLATGVASAILSFQQQNIDRVVFWAPGGGAWLLFARQAENQGYRPRYGVSTYDSARVIESNGATAKEQLRGLLGVGFSTASDLSNSAQPPISAREKACLDVVNRRSGTKYTERTAAGPALGACDALNLTRAALAPAVRRPLDKPQLYELFSGVGSRHEPNQFAETFFGQGVLDGISVYAPFTFEDECKCMRYRTAWQRIP